MATSTFDIEKFEGTQIDDEMVREAAELFTANYGVWGHLAQKKMGSLAKEGRRIRMSVERLKLECLPSSNAARNIYVRVSIQGKVVGNVFATRWTHNEQIIRWITQLCVVKQFRHKGLATRLLRYLRQEENDHYFGILSSHPGAILATLHAFGCAASDIDLSIAKDHGRAIMDSSPVNYGRSAGLRGSAFGEDGEGAVSCADTGFYVDHGEPMAALEEVRGKGIVWPFGELPEGCEFLAIEKSGRSG